MYQQCPILIINVKTGESHRCKNNITRLGVCYEHMLPVWREILRLTPRAVDGLTASPISDCDDQYPRFEQSNAEARRH